MTKIEFQTANQIDTSKPFEQEQSKRLIPVPEELKEHGNFYDPLCGSFHISKE
jgi:hypothetical protein